MKENIKTENGNLPLEIVKPIFIKLNKNALEDFNNFFPDELNFPENLTEKDINVLKEKNKWFFIEYSKLAESNNLLKFKLQELVNKKNEFHKYLNKLEHKEKNQNINNEEIFNNNSTISHDLINFQNNIYINRKRKRRKKSQIFYKYKCNFKDCNKKYSTEGALNQHIKFKHM